METSQLEDLAQASSEGEPGGPGSPEALAKAHHRLAELVVGITGDPLERRHEALMEQAEQELGLEREYAEAVYAIAQQESLAPVYAFLLLETGLGVRELEEPEPDMEETHQQAPPEWVVEDLPEFGDVALERRLRSTFRRFRHHLTEASDPGAAVASYVAEPDVDLVPLK